MLHFTRKISEPSRKYSGVQQKSSESPSRKFSESPSPNVFENSLALSESPRKCSQLSNLDVIDEEDGLSGLGSIASRSVGFAPGDMRSVGFAPVNSAAGGSDTVGGGILSVVKSFGEKFANIIFILLLIGYSFIGGYIFNWLEADNELQEGLDAATVWNHTYVERVVPEFVSFCNSEFRQLPDEGTRRKATRLAMSWMMKKLNLTAPGPTNNWDLWQSTFYATTLYTTIGYGDRAPSTTGGRAASIIYAIIGIPITLVMLNGWGKMLFHMMQALWRHMLKFFMWFPVTSWMIRRSKMRSTLAYMVSEQHALSTLFVFQNMWGIQQEEEDDEVNVPTWVAFILLFAWICIFAGIYTFIESEWTYFESFYFFFISLTTIGLGDFVPRTAASFYTSFPMILIGLSVISLCINVLQANVEELFNDLIDRVNLQYQSNMVADDDDDDEVNDFGWKKPPSIAVKSEGVREGMLMQFMGRSKRAMLDDRATKLSNRVSKKVQTDNAMTDSWIQCGVDTRSQADNTIGDVYIDCERFGSTDSIRSRLSRSASAASLLPKKRGGFNLFLPK